MQIVEKEKFLANRDLDLWGQPSFFVYQERMHRCPHCGHRQSLAPPFERRDVKYTLRCEEHVLTALIVSTAEDMAQRFSISAETVERIVRNRVADAKASRWPRLGRSSAWESTRSAYGKAIKVMLPS